MAATMLCLISMSAGRSEATTPTSSAAARHGAVAAGEVGFCEGDSTVPETDVKRDSNGNPLYTYIYVYAVQHCVFDGPFTQQVCVRIQQNIGGSWYALSAWRCSPLANSDPSLGVTQTVKCSDAHHGRYRTAAKGTATPVGGPSKTRYWYSGYEDLC